MTDGRWIDKGYITYTMEFNTSLYYREGLPTVGSDRSFASINHQFREDMIPASRKIFTVELINPTQDRRRDR